MSRVEMLHRMHKIIATFIAILFCGCAGEQRAQSKTPAPMTPRTSQPHGPRMIGISIDGLRPDLLLGADAPNIRSLIERGSFTFWAMTTDVAVTLPSHVSMLTG